MPTFGMHEAKTSLSRLVERAEQGEEILIARNGDPVARIVPIDRPGLAKVRGAWKGRVAIAEDFDDLPDDLGEAFGVR